MKTYDKIQERKVIGYVYKWVLNKIEEVFSSEILGQETFAELENVIMDYLCNISSRGLLIGDSYFVKIGKVGKKNVVIKIKFRTVWGKKPISIVLTTILKRTKGI